MRARPLTELLVVERRPDLPFCLRDRSLSGHSIHVLFHNPVHKQQYLTKAHYTVDPTTIVLDCGFNVTALQAGLVYTIDSISQLLKVLELIMLLEDIAVVLEHLVIDNFSNILWSLGQANKYPEASRLVLLLQEIQLRYGCSIIVFSWDACFDKGVGYNWTNANSVLQNASSIRDLSYLPPMYLDWFANLLHVGPQTRIWNKATKHWDFVEGLDRL